eukprot:1134265-Pelagomonas_calceolata.AAC.4
MCVRASELAHRSACLRSNAIQLRHVMPGTQLSDNLRNQRRLQAHLEQSRCATPCMACDSHAQMVSWYPTFTRVTRVGLQPIDSG